MRKNKLHVYLLLPITVALAVTLLIVFLWRDQNIAVLHPQGTVGQKERNLILFALVLSLIVVVPVFAMLFGFAWRYREGNHKARYSPNLKSSRLAETVWWLVPLTLITILSVVTWRSSHALDPFKPLASSVKPLRVQVVALQWKWLFIYPDQHVATVNYLAFPTRTPVDFEITADAPMNSFWIPALGGQIYAMSGMSTQLHLMSNTTGTFTGKSANISGSGFAGMHFTAQAMTAGDFSTWVRTTQAAPQHLTMDAYDQLTRPNTTGTAYYSQPDAGLYDTIVRKSMGATAK